MIGLWGLLRGATDAPDDDEYCQELFSVFGINVMPTALDHADEPPPHFRQVCRDSDIGGCMPNDSVDGACVYCGEKP